MQYLGWLGRRSRREKAALGAAVVVLSLLLYMTNQTETLVALLLAVVLLLALLLLLAMQLRWLLNWGTSLATILGLNPRRVGSAPGMVAPVNREVWDMANELRDVLPIHALSEQDASELVSHMHVRRFGEGEVVYHRGDPAADAFVVHRGLVKSVLHDQQGRELLVALCGRGEFFGTLTLFKSGARESSVVAVIPTTVLQIGRADALRVLERNPRAMYFMFERLADAIEQLSRLLEGIVFLDVASRLARYLIELEQPDGLVLTQEDIAAAIGSNRFTVNKLLADFERRGLITVERRQVRVLDEEGLRQEIRP